jgi:NADP-dependent 3-hydroxy acid dehydrogenase YdfG
VSEYTTAVVTGASGGIGRAVCVELVRLGMHVHALALPDAALDELGEVAGVTIHGIDVRDTTALTTALSALDVDVLVNNAGTIGDLQPAQMSNTAVADALIDINLRAAIHRPSRCCPAWCSATAAMWCSPDRSQERPTANSAIYSATKAALNAFADGLGWTCTARRRVTVLAPRRVETNLYDEALGGHDAAVTRLYSGTMALQPADVAAVVSMALTMPAHVDVTRIEVVPTGQVFGGSTIAQMD